MPTLNGQPGFVPARKDLPLAAFINRHAGDTGWVIGRGPTRFDFARLAGVPGPIFFINDAVAMEQHVAPPARDRTYFFAIDDAHHHWLRRTDDHDAIRSLPVLPRTDPWLAAVRGPGGPPRVCWWARGMGYRDEALKLERSEIAARGELYTSRGTIQPLIHFAWLCGVRKLVLIGCDGIVDPRAIYDPRLPALSGRQPGMAYDAIRALADRTMGLLGLECEYLFSPGATGPMLLPKGWDIRQGSPRLSLLTPTGDRPEAFALIERYMSRQTRRWHEWIVVDDGQTPTVTTLGQTVIRRQPATSLRFSQHENIEAGLDAVTGSAVVIIEDDDWYGPRYLESIGAMLDDGADLVGFDRARKYNVRERRYRACDNTKHACLARTAFCTSIMPQFRAVVAARPRYIDLCFWRAAQGRRMLAQTDQHVGIKGLPGRAGIERGHQPPAGWGQPDPDGVVLASWIPEDHEVYLPYADHPTQPALSPHAARVE